jgi:hypothetical protein
MIQMLYYTWCSSTEVEEIENNGDATSPWGSTTGDQPRGHPGRREKDRHKPTVDLHQVRLRWI